MFTNVGRKIKLLAKVVFWLGVVATVLMMLEYAVFLPQRYFGTNDATDILRAIVILVIGFFGAWASALLIYGFGEIVENSTLMANNVKPTNTTNMDRFQENDNQKQYYVQGTDNPHING